jgi:hypothetical protein
LETLRSPFATDWFLSDRFLHALADIQSISIQLGIVLMVSWVKALGTAVKVILVTSAWWILGAAISMGLILIVGNISFLSLLSNPTVLLHPASLIQELGKFITGVLIAWVVGATVAGLGSLATFLKYSAELYAQRAEAGAVTEHIVPRPSVTVHPLTTPRSKTCHSCREVNASTAFYCVNCGANLTARITLPLEKS